MTNEKTANGKKLFESPKAEVILFNAEDVITASEKDIDLPRVGF